MFKLSYYVFGFENKYCCLFLINKGTLLYDQPSYLSICLQRLWENIRTATLWATNWTWDTSNNKQKYYTFYHNIQWNVPSQTSSSYKCLGNTLS